MARRRDRRSTKAAPQRLILDSGAVIALSRADVRAHTAVARAQAAGAEIAVPSVVVAETVRGTVKDAPVNRALKQATLVVAADEAIGRTLAGRSRVVLDGRCHRGGDSGAGRWRDRPHR